MIHVHIGRQGRSVPLGYRLLLGSRLRSPTIMEGGGQLRHFRRPHYLQKIPGAAQAVLGDNKREGERWVYLDRQTSTS
jgi:hypothetical protein